MLTLRSSNNCFYCGEPMAAREIPNPFDNHKPPYSDPNVPKSEAQMRRAANHTNPLGPTRDHVIPRCRGGHRRINTGWPEVHFVMCHAKCNTDKAHLTLNEYRAVVAYRKGIPFETFRFPGEKEYGVDLCNKSIYG